MTAKKRLLTALLCFLIGITPSWGSVLCLADEGHLAAELIFGCDLSDASPCESPAGQGVCIDCAQPGDQENCNDIPLPSISQPTRCQFQKDLDRQLMTAIIPSRILQYDHTIAPTTGVDPIIAKFLAQNAPHQSISSVILRI